MMNLKITRATLAHKQYFSEDALNNGICYVVFDDSSIQGLFTYKLDGDKATLSFPFCLNKKAIQLCLETFLEEYSQITEIESLSKQNLSQLGFIKNLYKR